jgi:LuxR family maltose regulon positive regulatory protein
MATLEQGLALRRRHPIGVWVPTHHTLVMARVAVQAAEISMAQELIGDLNARLARFPDGMAAMRGRAERIQADLRALVADGAHEEPLTAREREILLLLQGSLSVREIGSALYLSPNTVKTHIQALYRKLGAHSRDEAVAFARRDQLI